MPRLDAVNAIPDRRVVHLLYARVGHGDVRDGRIVFVVGVVHAQRTAETAANRARMVYVIPLVMEFNERLVARIGILVVADNDLGIGYGPCRAFHGRLANAFFPAVGIRQKVVAVPFMNVRSLGKTGRRHVEHVALQFDHVFLEPVAHHGAVAPINISLSVVIDKDGRVDIVIHAAIRRSHVACNECLADGILVRACRMVRDGDANRKVPAVVHGHVPVELAVPFDSLARPGAATRPLERLDRKHGPAIHPGIHISRREYVPVVHYVAFVTGGRLVMPREDIHGIVVNEPCGVCREHVRDNGIACGKCTNGKR